MKRDIFPHDEYHIYTTATGIEFRHVHLGYKELAQARHLDRKVHGSMESDWQHQHRLPVGDNIYLTVGDVYQSPSLESKGYEGWELCQAGDFEEPLFFEAMIFHKCTSPDDSSYDSDWNIDNTRDKVLPEHQDAFDQALQDYIDSSDRKL